jgi:hypothetical protein
MLISIYYILIFRFVYLLKRCFLANCFLTVRDKIGRLISYIGVEEVGEEYKTRIIIVDHYKDYSFAKHYGIGGFKKEKIYNNE